MKRGILILMVLLPGVLCSQVIYKPIQLQAASEPNLGYDRVNRIDNVAAHFFLGLGISVGATSLYRELGMAEVPAKICGAVTGIVLCKVKEAVYDVKPTPLTLGADVLAFGVSFPVNDLIRLPYQKRAVIKAKKEQRKNKE